MAQSKSKSTKKKSTTRKQTAAKKTAAVSNKRQNNKDINVKDYWHVFTKTKFFVFLLGIVIILVLVGLDLLIAWNDFTKFFTFLGFEVLIAAVIWVLAMIFSIGSSKKNDDEVN